MTNIYLKRNELNEKSKNLRLVKFDSSIKNRDTSVNIDKEQNKIYKKFTFYNEYIKAINKKEVKDNEVHSKMLWLLFEWY